MQCSISSSHENSDHTISFEFGECGAFFTLDGATQLLLLCFVSLSFSISYVCLLYSVFQWERKKTFHFQEAKTVSLSSSPPLSLSFVSALPHLEILTHFCACGVVSQTYASLNSTNGVKGKDREKEKKKNVKGNSGDSGELLGLRVFLLLLRIKKERTKMVQETRLHNIPT